MTKTPRGRPCLTTAVLALGVSLTACEPQPVTVGFFTAALDAGAPDGGDPPDAGHKPPDKPNGFADESRPCHRLEPGDRCALCEPELECHDARSSDYFCDVNGVCRPKPDNN